MEEVKDVEMAEEKKDGVKRRTKRKKIVNRKRRNQKRLKTTM